MANTYTQIFLHVVFVVKGRMNVIPKDKKEELFAYIGGIIKNKNHKLYIVNGMADHVHVLFGCNPNESISDLIKEVKRNSSKYINENHWISGKFEWQHGFGAFSYSKSHVDKIYQYIKSQEEHHKRITFREEYISFLKKYGIDYDERYIFSDV